ncbi:hypothetical protein BS47DRAFT_1350031 [Hydnum rufescens UP504]|uniref:Uncharacterized protein n=1 Tax=Hydnum rufescens UP504 TaxID=1448309 RepID=A0A9P6ANG0_9AGAM|nr:hypothetical protein BS47DRAFT_1350031 [Hydnum rufescens UP504]
MALTSLIMWRLGQLMSDLNSNNALPELHRRRQILLLQSYGLSFGVLALLGRVGLVDMLGKR